MARIPAKKWSTREELLVRLELLRRHIHSHPARITLDEMAAAIGLSSFHFHRIFRQTYGMTPHEFVTECRLKRAHLLLSLREKTVSEVCIEVGFASFGSFSRLFKSKYGYPPSKTPAKWSANSKSQDSTSQLSTNPPN